MRTVIGHESTIPPGYVIIGRSDHGVVLARMPNEDGLLCLNFGAEPPRGWHLVSEDFVAGTAMFAPTAARRAWQVYFGARRLFARLAYPIAWRLLLALSRLARVELPRGMTLRGAMGVMGAAIEAERRAGRIGR